MKIPGGYMPRVPGRPVDELDSVPLAGPLCISLVRAGVRYEPQVAEGQTIVQGEALARAEACGGTLSLPAPATGEVGAVRGADSNPSIVLNPSESAEQAAPHVPLSPERSAPEEVRRTLADGGIWPFFWSTRTRGVPSLSVTDRPHSIMINCIYTEPFRARGKVILSRSWERVVQAIRFMPRLLEDYGRVEIVLTDLEHPLAKKMYGDLAGNAWVRFHAVALRYPVANPRVLAAALRRVDSSLSPEKDVWVIGVQDVATMGACLAEGRPLSERIVALGGPAETRPRHLKVPVGTRLATAFGDASTPDAKLLRGGLFNGIPVDPTVDTVQYDDDAYFRLLARDEREFLSFVRPGFDRRSILPCFASALTGGADRKMSTALRGEHRACIACGQCEKVCPARLFPQVLHRYLYRDALEEAEAAGLDRCVDCRLCTFVCPSKIELQQQFAEARERLREEHAETEAAEGNGVA